MRGDKNNSFPKISILPNSEPLEISLSKFQHFYHNKRYDFSPNLKGVAQKLGPPYPYEFLKAFGALDLNFLPKMSKTSNGCGGSIF